MNTERTEKKKKKTVVREKLNKKRLGKYICIPWDPVDVQKIVYIRLKIACRYRKEAENILIFLKEYIYCERDGFSPILEKLTITN